MIENAMLVALSKQVEIKDENYKTLWDFIVANKTIRGFKNDEVVIQNFITTWRDAISRTQGTRQTGEIRNSDLNAIGRSLSIFRSFFPAHLFQRFTPERIDEISKKTYKGRYLSHTPVTGGIHAGLLGSFIFGPIGLIAGPLVATAGLYHAPKSIKSNSRYSIPKQITETAYSMWRILTGGLFGIKPNKEKADFGVDKDIDADNLESLMVEMFFMLGFSLLWFLTKALWDDEDEPDDIKRISHNIITNQITNILHTFTDYFDFREVHRTLTDLPVLNILKDSYYIGVATQEAIEGKDEILTGTYAGQSKLWRSARKMIIPSAFQGLVPGFSEYLEKDVIDKHAFLGHDWKYGDEKEAENELKRIRHQYRSDTNYEKLSEQKQKQIDSVLKITYKKGNSYIKTLQEFKLLEDAIEDSIEKIIK